MEKRALTAEDVGEPETAVRKVKRRLVRREDSDAAETLISLTGTTVVAPLEDFNFQTEDDVNENINSQNDNKIDRFGKIKEHQNEWQSNQNVNLMSLSSLNQMNQINYQNFVAPMSTIPISLEPQKMHDFPMNQRGLNLGSPIVGNFNGNDRSLSRSYSSASSAHHSPHDYNSIGGHEGQDDDVVVKGAWSTEEDQKMLEAVHIFGHDWKKIASCIPGRSPKQCRDRYRLKLDPTINHGPWTPAEDALLLQLHDELGRQWTKIAKLLPGRTENSVKSRYSSLFRSKNREWTEEEEAVIKQLHGEGVGFDEIATKHLTHRSEHAVRKRWEKIHMQEIAQQIKSEIPEIAQELESNGQKQIEVKKKVGRNGFPKLNPALAATTASTVTRANKQSARETLAQYTKDANASVNAVLENCQSMLNDPQQNGGLNVTLNYYNSLQTQNQLNALSMAQAQMQLQQMQAQGLNLNDLGGFSLQHFNSFTNSAYGDSSGFPATPTLNHFLSSNSQTLPNLQQDDSKHDDAVEPMMQGDSLDAPRTPEIHAIRSALKEDSPAKGSPKKVTIDLPTAVAESDFSNDQEHAVAKRRRQSRLKKHSTSTTVMMQLIGEPLTNI